MLPKEGPLAMRSRRRLRKRLWRPFTKGLSSCSNAGKGTLQNPSREKAPCKSDSAQERTFSGVDTEFLSAGAEWHGQARLLCARAPARGSIPAVISNQSFSVGDGRYTKTEAATAYVSLARTVQTRSSNSRAIASI